MGVASVPMNMKAPRIWEQGSEKTGGVMPLRYPSNAHRQGIHQGSLPSIMMTAQAWLLVASSYVIFMVSQIPFLKEILLPHRIERFDFTK
jgi:hypothetical protein